MKLFLIIIYYVFTSTIHESWYFFYQDQQKSKTIVIIITSLIIVCLVVLFIIYYGGTIWLTSQSKCSQTVVPAPRSRHGAPRRRHCVGEEVDAKPVPADTTRAATRRSGSVGAK